MRGLCCDGPETMSAWCGCRLIGRTRQLCQPAYLLAISGL
jgi:hypothetical protein